jgi:hypothetical protein
VALVVASIGPVELSVSVLLAPSISPLEDSSIGPDLLAASCLLIINPVAFIVSSI